MKRLPTARRFASVTGLLLLVGCGSHNGAQEIGDRMQLRLTPELAGGNAVLERLPDGARVTLSEQALFPYGSAQLDDRGRYILASVIQSLLNPQLIQIDVTEPGTPTSLQQDRARAVTEYLHDFQITPDLHLAGLTQSTPPATAGTMPQQLAVTVTLVARPAS